MAEESTDNASAEETTTETESTDTVDEVEKWKSLSRKHEKASKAAEKAKADLEARLAKIEEDSKSDNDKALEQARTEAADAATKEITAKANRRIVAAEVKAAAGTKLADPADAIRLLDLDEFDVDDDGEVDTAAIGKAIDGLLKDKPYLAAKGRPKGDIDQGARGDKNVDVGPGMDRLRHAYATSDK